ncbi:ESPR-type extended signal peptide-containing protein [Variovorax fucosicus]|uniref:ESPR-type extended signal peptide-containing protein n=1 Tax=Variovorax fucosicus TaxID=3053517 RepID=UPI0033655BC9
MLCTVAGTARESTRMNKNFHRVVFNAARGLRMVVQETATSAGKGASKATSAAVFATAGATRCAASMVKPACSATAAC